MSCSRSAAPCSPYDELYASTAEPLWSRPGRLVRRIGNWLPPGSVVWDAGCGDGKNALYLVKHGYRASGVDISSLAIQWLRDRFARAGEDSSSFRNGDVCNNIPPEGSVDCLVSYGLYHCLDADNRIDQHRKLQGTVRPGGYVLFCTLTDALPIPASHRTPGAVVASQRELSRLFAAEKPIEISNGFIREDHPPLVGRHEHSVTWMVMRRPV